MVTPSVSDLLSGIAARESVSAVSKMADWLGYKLMRVRCAAVAAAASGSAFGGASRLALYRVPVLAIAVTASYIAVWSMAKFLAAKGGAVLSVWMAFNAVWFQSMMGLVGSAERKRLSCRSNLKAGEQLRPSAMPWVWRCCNARFRLPVQA
ncbi:MAG: hypothetical protein KME26_16595 [Oscillatoria princeps RMCB-10]|nr:hypothetical protein [Oscillatoria princeps RMCB-10]